MKKQYMDIIPAKKQKTNTSNPSGSGARVVKKTSVSVSKNQAGERRASVTVLERGAGEKKASVAVLERGLGEKRASVAVPKKAEEKKPRILIGRKSAKTVKNTQIDKPTVANPNKTSVRSERVAFAGESTGVRNGRGTTIPKNPFITNAKVPKRPLSNTAYNKEVEAPVEKPKGPVTIITKPEKDSHAGLIIAIVLTVILGAAAGTVAFLLLPK